MIEWIVAGALVVLAISQAVTMVSNVINNVHYASVVRDTRFMRNLAEEDSDDMTTFREDTRGDLAAMAKELNGIREYVARLATEEK